MQLLIIYSMKSWGGKVNENSEGKIGENMRRDKDEWLQQKIDEDLQAMADEQEKMLMEMEELQGIDLPEEKLQDLHRAIEADRRASRKKKLRLRPLLIAAAVLVLCVGTGLVSTGNRVYVPEILNRESGTKEAMKINTDEMVASEYDEEEVCQEIEEKLGVIPVRFGYRPKDMALFKYEIEEDTSEVLMSYRYDGEHFMIYISKDVSESTISNQVDGEKTDTVLIASCGMEIPVYEYVDPYGYSYFEASFEYLNTYYSIKGMMEQEEFQKIVENIWIKNV